LPNNYPQKCESGISFYIVLKNAFKKPFRLPEMNAAMDASKAASSVLTAVSEGEPYSD